MQGSSRLARGLAYAQAYLTYRQGGGPLGGNDPARNPNRVDLLLWMQGWRNASQMRVQANTLTLDAHL